MGYKSQGPLNDNGHALVEPLSHIDGWQCKDITNLGYATKDDLPKCSKDAPIGNIRGVTKRGGVNQLLLK